MILMITLAMPTAAKMLLIIGLVYGILQGAKKIPLLTKYLTGWIAIGFNVFFTALGLLVAIPADQLYTSSTGNALLMLLVTSMGSAGLHGTVKSLSPPTVLAVTPPSTVAKEVPATLIPNDPAAIPAADLKAK